MWYLQGDRSLLVLRVSGSVEMSGVAQVHNLSLTKMGVGEGLFSPTCQVRAF